MRKLWLATFHMFMNMHGALQAIAFFSNRKEYFEKLSAHFVTQLAKSSCDDRLHSVCCAFVNWVFQRQGPQPARSLYQRYVEEQSQSSFGSYQLFDPWALEINRFLSFFFFFFFPPPPFFPTKLPNRKMFIE